MNLSPAWSQSVKSALVFEPFWRMLEIICHQQDHQEAEDDKTKNDDHTLF